MKLSALLAETEESQTSSDRALLSALIDAASEIESEIDYDFKSGKMHYHKGSLLTWQSGVFGKTGRCMADSFDVVESAKNEKVELMVAGFDFNYEDVYIVPTNSEILVKKSGKPGNFIVKFRSRQYELPGGHLTKVIQDFYDSDIFEYRRIGKRVERSEDGDDEYSRGRRFRSFDKNDNSQEKELTEDDYEFDDSTITGALIFKNLHHE